MNRALLAGFASASLLAPAVQAQSFQFMSTVARARESLLPVPRYWWGYAASGDLDGDGRSDLVATHDLGASVMLRSATGWNVPQGYVGSLGQRPVLADFDGDGDLDLAFVPPRPGTQRPPLDLYSNALGTMTPVALPAIMVGLSLQGVAVGRVDGDAFADLVVATPASLGAPPLVLVRGGAGLQFTIDLLAFPAAGPSGLWPELLDADGDGDLDVLATNATSGLRLLQNQGGTFVDATATLPAARTGHAFLVRGDFDGDGRDDCAATLANGDVDVLWGAAGTLSFAPAVASVPGLRTVTPADFDGDGDLDLLAEHPLGLDVLWNRGNRQFARAELVAEPTSMRGVGDVDGDGVADVVFAATSAEEFARCKYRALHEDAAFAAGILPLPEGRFSISAAGDVDGDGRTDLVTSQWSRITVDHALGAHAYRRTVSPLAVTADAFWRTELGDLDRDGDLDFVVKDQGRLSIAANDGTGTFSWSMQIPAVSYGLDLCLGDGDGDGDLDIVHVTSAGVMMVRNLGGGQYSSAVIAVPQVSPATCIALADVDGDGDLDLIANIDIGGGQWIAANNGQGVFAPSPAFSFAPNTDIVSMRAADIDADGDVDLVVRGQHALVFRNNGSGSFTDTTAADLQQTGLNMRGNVVVADLDDDGDPDLAMVRTATGGAIELSLLFNNGAGRFFDLSTQRRPPLGLTMWQLRPADLDDDGDVDLIASTLDDEVFSYNHLRQGTSASLPTLGGLATLDLFSGPGFGQPGLGLLAFSAAPTAVPAHVPGIAGQLDFDGATLQIATAFATSPVGLSRVFVSVPPDGALFGLEVWFQGAIWPSAGAPPGFTNATREVILR